MRWSIEPFHKVIKSLLKLGKEFEGRSYDMMISHTTIVFSRYLVLEWERRENNDDRTCGGLFFLFCDEIKDMVRVSKLTLGENRYSRMALYLPFINAESA
jgi:hypothetical protein